MAQAHRSVPQLHTIPQLSQNPRSSSNHNRSNFLTPRTYGINYGKATQFPSPFEKTVATLLCLISRRELRKAFPRVAYVRRIRRIALSWAGTAAFPLSRLTPMRNDTNQAARGKSRPRERVCSAISAARLLLCLWIIILAGTIVSWNSLGFVFFWCWCVFLVLVNDGKLWTILMLWSCDFSCNSCCDSWRLL